MNNKLRVNEVFQSLQGEGVRVGTLNHFIRLSGCNLACDIDPGPLSPGGFACDSEFVSGIWMTLDEILAELNTINPNCKNIIWTGGEPGLQLRREHVDFLRTHGYHQAIETNGTVDVTPLGLNWVTCSPKVAEHAIRLKSASEIKYVRGSGQGIPRPTCHANYNLLSPAFNGLEIDRRALFTCMRLIQENPEWRLSVQMHKYLSVR